MDKKTTTTEEEIIKHAVVYTDGSAYPNPSHHWGGGYHGYTYKESTLGTKSGNRPSKFIISDKGYIDVVLAPKTEHKTVVPDTYINGYYSGNVQGSNNTGEVMAIIKTIEWFLANENIKTLSILADSTYALGMVTKCQNHVDWKSHTTKNLEYWAMMQRLIDEAKEVDLKIIPIKVEAHSNDWGNDIADQLALLGRLNSAKYGLERSETIVAPETKYWKDKVDKHPFTNYRHLYFLNGNDPENIGKYAVLNYKKDAEPGRKSHEASFGLIKLSEPIEIVERSKIVYQEKLKSLSVISAVDTDMLFNQNTTSMFKMFGNDIFTYNTRGRKHLSVLEEDIVVAEIQPPGLATGALDKVIMMERYLNEYQNNTMKATVYTDITNLCFEANDKGNMVTTLTTDDKFISIDYKTKDGKKVKLNLELGIDLITRNSIKKLEKLEPVVTLVTNELSNNYIEYYIIIETKKNKDIGIWCNYFSNGIYH